MTKKDEPKEVTLMPREYRRVGEPIYFWPGWRNILEVFGWLAVVIIGLYGFAAVVLYIRTPLREFVDGIVTAVRSMLGT